MEPGESIVPLSVHPSTPAGAVRAVEVSARLRAGELLLRYVLHGELTRILVPDTLHGGRADDLWKHTCFEVFIRAEGSRDYYEFNFSPSRQWASFHFDSYRRGMSHPDMARAPTVSLESSLDRLQMNAAVHLADLPGLQPDSLLALALCAVVEDRDGKLSYWAQAHAPGKADFHASEGFALPLVLTVS